MELRGAGVAAAVRVAAAGHPVGDGAGQGEAGRGEGGDLGGDGGGAGLLAGGAIVSNGNLYCPATPRTLLELGPLARASTPEQAAAHDAKTAEAARYKLGRLTRDDEDGYHRVQCPAAAGKIRCPLRPPSMPLDRDRPDILTPPQHPQACCTRQTITIPAGVLAKTAQKHDYPSAAWRRSYARRSGAERGFATAKDPASNTISRGWCRLTGLTPLMLFTTVLLAVRNHRILAAWNARQDDSARRAALTATLTSATATIISTARREPALTRQTAARNSGKSARSTLEPGQPRTRPPSRPESQTQT